MEPRSCYLISTIRSKLYAASSLIRCNGSSGSSLLARRYETGCPHSDERHCKCKTNSHVQGHDCRIPWGKLKLFYELSLKILMSVTDRKTGSWKVRIRRKAYSTYLDTDQEVQVRPTEMHCVWLVFWSSMSRFIGFDVPISMNY